MVPYLSNRVVCLFWLFHLLAVAQPVSGASVPLSRVCAAHCSVVSWIFYRCYFWVILWLSLLADGVGGSRVADTKQVWSICVHVILVSLIDWVMFLLCCFWSWLGLMLVRALMLLHVRLVSFNFFRKFNCRFFRFLFLPEGSPPRSHLFADFANFFGILLAYDCISMCMLFCWA